MSWHETEIHVRYAETDQMGIVHHANYLVWFELGRTNICKAKGFSYREMEESGIMMPVYENYSRYLQPARYDDELTIKVTIPDLPTARVVFRYEIRNQDNVLINTGETTLVFLNRETNRPNRAPKGLIEKLKPYFEVGE